MRQMMEWDRTVVVNKALLLNKLRENLNKHLEEYEDAVAGYKEEAAEKLAEAAEKLAEGKKLAEEKLERAYKRVTNEIACFDPESASDVVVFCEAIRFDLVAPKKFESSYQQAIQMFWWEERKEIELSTRDFCCFVMDEWEWRDEFNVSNTRYFNKVKR